MGVGRPLGPRFSSHPLPDYSEPKESLTTYIPPKKKEKKKTLLLFDKNPQNLLCHCGLIRLYLYVFPFRSPY